MWQLVVASIFGLGAVGVSYVDFKKRGWPVPPSVGLLSWINDRRQWNPIGHWFLHKLLTEVVGVMLFTFLSASPPMFFVATTPSFGFMVYQEFFHDGHLKRLIEGTETPLQKWDFIGDLLTRFFGLTSGAFFLWGYFSVF